MLSGITHRLKEKCNLDLPSLLKMNISWNVLEK